MPTPFFRDVIVASLALCYGSAVAQPVFTDMPRHDRYEKLLSDSRGSVTGGVLFPNWSEDGSKLSYIRDGKTVEMDLTTLVESSRDFANGDNRPRFRRGGPARGRQYDSATSSDGKYKCESRDRNVFISDSDGKNEYAVTTDGSLATRVKYGTACWVYGEELDVHDAMWWSPDGTKLAFYRFDESAVRDYFLGLNQTSIQDALDVEPYPKAGAPNPKVSLLIYDLATKTTTSVRADFGDPSLAEYVYDVRWSPDGKELLFNRTNRKQNVMQLCAANPSDGWARTVVEERQPQSWAENHPDILFLKDNRRFVWSSERDGFKNFYLYDLDGHLLAQLSHNKFDAIDPLAIEERPGDLFYTSYGKGFPYNRQLHRVSLDGAHDVQLTDDASDNEVSLSPDCRHFTDVISTITTPPTTLLYDSEGKQLKTLAKSNDTKFKALHLRKLETFTAIAADSRTTLYGTLQFPSDFDPHKKYPVLLDVYGGPESGGLNAAFQTPNPITELGFIVVNVASRGTMGRGKAFRDAMYKKLGITEIDDQALAIESLKNRPYVDLNRVGVFGTSYGGYFTVMSMLRHPELYKAGCASSPVTDWHNYDSIYTERYEGLPDSSDNEQGYKASSAMTYAQDLKGWLMLYYGTADNNVHPSNTIQFVQTLEDRDKHYDLQVGPDRGHSQMNSSTMWTYLVQHLILGK